LSFFAAAVCHRPESGVSKNGSKAAATRSHGALGAPRVFYIPQAFRGVQRFERKEKYLDLRHRRS
jgi:hypothetical protein